MDQNQIHVAPTFEDREAMWQSLDFEEHQGSYPQMERYLKALRERFSNGQVLFNSFSAPKHPVFDWYFQHGCRLYDCNFFERFWRAETPSSFFPYQPKPLNYFEKSLFEGLSPFSLGAELSQILFFGGAYSNSAGYGQKARALGEAAAAELNREDYEATEVFRCVSPWSDFFMDVAWDHTVMVISKPQRLIHVILATDTD